MLDFPADLGPIKPILTSSCISDIAIKPLAIPAAVTIVGVTALDRYYRLRSGPEKIHLFDSSVTITA
jgi:hypothetical protein